MTRSNPTPHQTTPGLNPPITPSPSLSHEFDPPSAVRERLVAFGIEVLAEAINRPVPVRTYETTGPGLGLGSA
jgi:hypothetical protein